MDTTRTYNDPDATADYERTTLAAAFADKDRAHDAIHRLHDEGFRDTWLGVTRADEGADDVSTASDQTRVEADNWFMRFFGEGDESLHDALVRHGVSETDAQAAGALPAHSAIVTVDGANHPELAAQIISELGGQLITRGFGAQGYGAQGTYAGTLGAANGTAASGSFASGRTPAGATTTTAGAYDTDTEIAAPAGGAMPSNGGASFATTTNAADDRYSTDVPLSVTGATSASDAPLTNEAYNTAAASDYGSYRGGKTIDEDTRLQLREERLRIDKERVSRGEATIGKNVVTQAQEVDVPLIREELFIERRPVSGASAEATGAAIGSESEVVRIPLTEERVNVSKTAVVTEEVVVGKRQIEETGHVSETTRREELTVNDVDANGTGRTKIADRS